MRAGPGGQPDPCAGPTAPEELRAQLRDLTTRKRVAKDARFRPGRSPDTAFKATKLALKTLAQRFRQFDDQIKTLDRQITRLVQATAPKMVARKGIGIHTTATLLITAGDNPERLRSEPSFAALDRHLTARGILRTAQGAPAQPWR